MSDKQPSSNSASSTSATNDVATSATAAGAAHASSHSASSPNSGVKLASAVQVRIQLFNASGATLAVPIINKTTGDTDTVFVQHGGKPKLTVGYTVDPVFASRHPSLQVTKVNN